MMMMAQPRAKAPQARPAAPQRDTGAVQASAWLKSMPLRRILLTDDWVHRQLLIGVRDATAVPRQARLLIDHLCASATVVDPQSATPG